MPRPAPDHPERGDVAPTVILTTLTVFLVMFVIQMGLYFHARTVLNAAVDDGTRAAQARGGSADDAQQAVDQVLAGSTSLLVSPVTRIELDTDTVTVAVTADIPSLVPFWSGEVRAQASGPVERFRSERERGGGP